MQVSYYMSRPVVTVTPQTEFHRAFDLMRARGIHHLPVVEAGRIVGIVGERDLLLAAANFGSAEVPIGEIMRSPVVCVSDRTGLKQAARMLIENHIGSLPVLNARKDLVGIITETDIFMTIAGMLPSRLVMEKAARKPPAKKSPATKKPAVAKKKSPRAGAAAKKAPASKRGKPSPARKTARARTSSR